MNKTPILDALSIMFISFSILGYVKNSILIIDIEHAITKMATIPTIDHATKSSVNCFLLFFMLL